MTPTLWLLRVRCVPVWLAVTRSIVTRQSHRSRARITYAPRATTTAAAAVRRLAAAVDSC